MRTLSLLSVILLLMGGTSTTFAQSSIAVNQDPDFNLLYSKSPLMQFKSGIASKDVKCHDNFLLTFKAKDGSPACVKPETAQTLIMRGWGTFTAPSIDNTYDQKINGTLSGNVVLAGGPRPGPQANYEVDVYATDGVTIVGKTLSDDNGNYSIQLSAGNYTIYASDYPIKQTHFVSVYPYKNTIFNIAYGTGYK